MIRYGLSAALMLVAEMASAQGVVRPIFDTPGGITPINDLIKRTETLGGLDTKKIADALDKGFPNITPPSGSLSDQAKGNKAPEEIRLAGNDPKDTPKDAPQNNGIVPSNSEFKQTVDAISGVFKMQADVLRSINISGAGRPAVAEGPTVSGGRTGFELARVSPELAEQLKLPAGQGLLIKNVFPKTPAEDAGYKKNDVLMEFGGRKVPNDLIDFMDLNFRFVQNNTPISGVVIRSGEKLEVGTMKLTDRRVIPALPNEQPADLTQIIQVAPGINSSQPNTVRVRQLRAIARPGGIVEYIWVDPVGKR